MFTYQYASVKLGFKFPANISYQILEFLYIPEVDPRFIQGNYADEAYVDKLLDQAYIQTGNSDEVLDSKNELGKKKNWYYPSGKITIFDTRLNTNIGLQGVEVRARRWFVTYTDKTDFNGNFRSGRRFKRPCNYSLWFKTDDFVVRESVIGLTAWINGPKQTGDWNYNINDGYDRFVGHVFRGAYRYHYGFIDGLERPFRKAFRTKYIAKDKAKDWSGVNWIVLPIIKIARYYAYVIEKVEYNSDEIFSTTIHETAHTSHALLMPQGIASFWQVSDQLRESWAVGVEWWLTKLEYKNTRGIVNYGDWSYGVQTQYPNQFAYQYWRKQTGSKDYTSLYINLMDDYNEFNQKFYGKENGLVYDDVDGYTIASLERNIVKNAFGLSSLNTYLKKYMPPGMNGSIDALLMYYTYH